MSEAENTVPPDYSEAEEIVRDYLIVLKDPNKARDQAAIEQCQAALDEARNRDPVEYMKLRVQLRRLSSDEGRLQEFEDAFVEVVADWAEESGVTAQDLRDEGVPRDVLQRAGLVTGRSSGPRAPKGAVNDAVRALAESQKFTIADVAEHAGSSRVAARAAVVRAVEAGLVKETGEEAANIRGRASKVYAAA